MRPAHVAVKILRLDVKGERVRCESVQRRGDRLDAIPGQIRWRRQRALVFVAARLLDLVHGVSPHRGLMSRRNGRGLTPRRAGVPNTIAMRPHFARNPDAKKSYRSFEMNCRKRSDLEPPKSSSGGPSASTSP